MTAPCARCGDTENQPGVSPTPHVDTLTVRVNDTTELLRVALCQFCRALGVDAMRRALVPRTESGATARSDTWAGRLSRHPFDTSERKESA